MKATLDPGDDQSGTSSTGRCGLVAALAFGVALDAVNDGPPGLGLAVAATLGLTAAVAIGRPGARGVPFLAAAVLPTIFVAVRANPVLQAIDVAAAASLVAIGASFARVGAPTRTGARAYAWRSSALLTSLPTGVTTLVAGAGGDIPSAQLRRAVHSAIVVASVVLAFAVLLGTGDAVFGHLLVAPARHLDLASIPPHALVVGIGAVAFTTLLVRLRRPTPVPAVVDAPIRAPGFSEWKIVLAAVDFLFAGFVVVQFAALFRGRAGVLGVEDLTFAEYARSGFWQLLAAAVLSGAVLTAAWVADGHAPSFRWLGGALLVLDIVVLISAARRLSLYEDAFGFTWPRLLGHAAVIAVGAMLLCGLVAVLTRRAAWLPTAGVVIALATVLGLNAVDPDRSIAERNLDRWRRTGLIDARELASLSADAAPVLSEALPSLPPCEGAIVAKGLREMRRELVSAASRGWPSWNLAREDAADALVGPPPSAATGACPAPLRSVLPLPA